MTATAKLTMTVMVMVGGDGMEWSPGAEPSGSRKWQCCGQASNNRVRREERLRGTRRGEVTGEAEEDEMGEGFGVDG